MIYPAHYLRSSVSIRRTAVDAENPTLVLPARYPQSTQCESKAAPLFIDDMKAPSLSALSVKWNHALQSIAPAYEA